MKIRSINSLSITVLFALLTAGCGPTVPQPKLPEHNTTRQAMWQDTSSVEANYDLKPEPYSLDSNEHDPELLGPQSTLKEPLTRAAEEHAGETDSQFLAKEDSQPQPSSSHGMTKSRCISLIGQSKFDEYTKQFGSEAAAIRKCIILERVQKQ